MHARLVPLDDASPIELVKDLTLVGRNEDCDVRIDHKSVSKLHCILVKTDGLILVRDLGSTNGTRVNGHRIRRAALLPNDHLAIAAFRYRVKFGEGPDRPPDGEAPGPNGAAEVLGDDESADAPAPAKAAPAIRRNALPDTYPDSPRA